MDSSYSKEPFSSSDGSTKSHGNQPSSRKHARGARPWPLQLLSHVLSLLWLAPAVILLYLNFTEVVIGNTLWCPSHDCVVLGDSKRAIEGALKYDRLDHDVNGALLFAQKGIEVWFTAVAALLVYDVAIMIARREGGLPVGYLLSHLEFSDPLNFFNPLVWKSAFSKRSSTGSVSKGAKTPGALTLGLFAVLLTFLTVLTNLMGPAGGVLVLPTVQWVDTKRQVQEQYHDLLSANPPRGSAFENCTANELADEKYSCTRYVYGPMLQNIISSVVASGRANAASADHGRSTLADTLVSEALLQFSFLNSTSDQPGLLFVPNRQALRSLSFHVLTDDGLLPFTYTDSIEAMAHRSGPALGSFIGFGFGNVTTHNITADKTVRCLDNWFDVSAAADLPDTYTKCIRVGKGWSAVNEDTGFSFRNRTDLKQDEGGDDDLLVNIYFTDKSTYFNESTDFGSGLGACAKQSSYRDCNWDAIFSTQMPANLSRTSTNSLLTELYFRDDVERQQVIWVDLTSYPLWADYQLRASPFATAVVTTTNTSVPDVNASTPVVVHPDWVLAAWSVNSTGFINGTSTLGSMFANLVSQDIDPNDDSTGLLELIAVLYLTTAHALSLIPYSQTNLNSSTPPAALDKNGVYFYFWRSRRVWMYSLGSRTATIGVVVVVIGMVVVVLRTLLALYEKLRHNYTTRAVSATELIVATLAHQYDNDFENIADESGSAQVRYHIEDDRGVLKFRVQRRNHE